MSIYESTKVKPYVYWLTHKTTGQFYIGYREANKLPSDQDLPIYKTSSNKVKKLGFENFYLKIVAEFLDGSSAYNFENRLIEEHFKNPLCLNGHYKREGDFKWRNAAGKPRHSHIFNNQWRQKQRESHLGRKDSPDTFIKKSIAQSGENNPRSKTWTILKESDNTILKVKSLKPWCRSLNLSYDALGKTLKSKEFFQGYKLLEKE